MKLKFAAAITSVIVFLSMGIILMAGIFVRPSTDPVNNTVQNSGSVALSISPTTMYKNGYATITWVASDDTLSCEAGGEWSGTKTAYGQESTGRLTAVGQKEYTIICKNSNGNYQAKTTLTVTE